MVSTSKLSQITSSGVLTKENIAAKQQEYNVRTPAATATAATPNKPDAAATAPPANASAAPSKGSGNLFTGLCEALNQHQRDLVKKGIYEVADEYDIVFAPPAIGASQVVKPGPVTYSNTASKAVDTASAKLDNTTDSVNVKSQIWQVNAGTQIVQLIDQIMRSSRYITDQQTVNIDVNGKQTKNTTANTKGITAWYKISVSAKQLGYDKKRRDNAYRMTFLVAPYAINQMISPYFPASTYRGAHKAYNYWFTGLNKEILSYEQQYNQAYYTTMNADLAATARPLPGRDQTKQTYMATSEQRTQGQANYVNSPAENAAAFLYSLTDFGQVQMKIIGDPAWLQQGEVSVGVNAKTFDFKPFNPDGTINFDSQQVVFTVSFNRPTDYNFSTGVMNTNSGSGAPQETFAYQAVACKNVFSKGQYTQELVGRLLPLENEKPGAVANARPTTSTATGSRSSPTTAEQIVAEQNASFEYGTTEGSEQTRMLAEQDAGLFDEPKQPQTAQPAAPPGAPESTGAIGYVEDTEAPPNASSASNADAALAAQTSAENAYYAAGSPRSGPIYEAYNNALNVTDQAQTQAENAYYKTPGLEFKPAPYLGKELGAVPQPRGLTAVPQPMNKEY